MSEPCDALKACEGVDSRLLLQRTIYGPQFGFTPQASVLGVISPGAGLRPFADVILGVQWRQVGLCQGPPSSVMSLAPGEVVTVGIRMRQSRSFSQLIRDAAESSRTSSSSSQKTTQVQVEPAPQTAGGGDGGSDFLDTVIKLAPILISFFGSWWNDAITWVEDAAGDLVGAAESAGAAAAKAVGDLLDNLLHGGGGSSTPMVQTSSVVDEVLDTITRSESQSHLRQTTVTTAEETEQTTKRVFGNPYLNRTLQLRFIPVFSQFEVTVWLARVTPGLVVHFAEPGAAYAGTLFPPTAQVGAQRGLSQGGSARPVAAALESTEQSGDNDGVRMPMVMTLRSLSGRGEGGRAVLERGLSWDRTEVRGNGIHVPLTAASDVISAWKLKGDPAKRLEAALERTRPAALEGVLKPLVRTISVYAGTHVEAVPGTCVLPDIPDDFKVIVPGGSQYAIQEKKTE